MPNSRGKVGIKSRGNGCSSLGNLIESAKVLDVFLNPPIKSALVFIYFLRNSVTGKIFCLILQ